ncbi:MAG: hypothetical protein M1823_006902, partial [Watsoniomyces obsoletus]
MPGAYSLDVDLDFSRPVAKPSFYIPPSPSASSVLSSSVSKTLSSSNLHCRKRPRIASPGDSTATPKRIHSANAFTSTSTFNSDAPSPAPLVNTDYRIAGGLDTSTAERGRQEDQAQFEFEQDLRPTRYGGPTRSHIDGYFPQTPASATLGSRKRSYSRLPRQSRPGWGHTVWTLTGGVAGKVFNFCWNSAFNGFHAGGGQGYHMQIDTPTVTADTGMEIDGPYDVFDKGYRARGSTPVPGGYPEDNLIEDY